MQPTAESHRARWLILLGTWMVCAALVLLHQAAVHEYVTLLNGLGRRDAAEVPTPLRQVIPARYADAQMWVRHVLSAQEAGSARVRTTIADNAPLGREVHWSSAFAWLLRGAGAVGRAFTGQSGLQALERVLLWFNAPLLFALVIVVSAWVGARAGAGAGAVVAAAMAGHPRFYEGFLPTNVDHHGCVNAAVLGLMLGIAFMGGGWWRPAPANGPRVLPNSIPRARRAAIIAALCGATGLWFSAAATVPVIALLGAAGLAVAWIWGPVARGAGAIFEPALWQLWGRVGAAASFVFYLVEYAPAHFSLRLEVNHPLYALAWWGGAELVAQLAAWRLAAPAPFRTVRRRLLWPLLALFAVPLVALLAGGAAFSVGDPFVGELRHFVAEGRSLPATVRQVGLRSVAGDLAALLLPAIAVVAVWRRRGDARIVPGLLALVTAVLVGMAFIEMRWWLNVGAAQIALLVALLALVIVPAAPARANGIFAAIALLCLLPLVGRIFRDRGENHRRAVAAGDLLQPLYRDIAVTLRASQPDGAIVLLASPNASAGIGYFGRFQTLGTLFWENAAGLRAAAEIYSTASDDEARALMRARQVTHVAMISTANFLGEYHRLLHPQASLEQARQSFGYRLAAAHPPPPWLQPVPYRPPADLRDAVERVRLYKVSPDQTEMEWRYHTAIAQLAEGDISAAEKSLEAAVARAAAPDRFALWEAGGTAFYDYSADAAAVRMFRRALALADDPNVAVTAAWILATSRDPAVRDGVAALALAEPVAVRAPADPTGWSALAAANAELGRFPAAIAAAERAVAAARAAGDPATETLLQKRLAAFRGGRPWRQ